jgi:NAD(P)-dependent dehydrogenase (short-subunit alcohol dehydrogenase family)
VCTLNKSEIVRYLAAELVPEKIRVNAVCGGIIETDALIQFPDAENYLNKIVKHTPAGSIGKPEDIANAVLFLRSAVAEFIYGHVLLMADCLFFKHDRMTL